MGEALGLLGGGRLEGKAGDHEADDGPSGGCSWMASMSKEQRLRDVVCLRLKQAVERVRCSRICLSCLWLCKALVFVSEICGLGIFCTNSSLRFPSPTHSSLFLLMSRFCYPFDNLFFTFIFI